MNPEEQPQENIFYFIEHKTSRFWISQQSIGPDNELKQIIYTLNPTDALKFYLHHKASTWSFMNKLRTDHTVTEHMFL